MLSNGLAQQNPDLNDAVTNVIFPLDQYKHAPCPGETSYDTLITILYEHFTPGATNLNDFTATPRITHDLLIRISMVLFQLQGNASEIRIHKFLPAVLRCLRCWRLLHVEEKRKRGAIDQLVQNLAALLNCPSSIEDEEPDRRRMRIKWISTVEGEVKCGRDDAKDSSMPVAEPSDLADLSVPKDQPLDQVRYIPEPSSPKSCRNHTTSYRSGCFCCQAVHGNMSSSSKSVIPAGIPTRHASRSLSLDSIPSSSHGRKNKAESSHASATQSTPSPIPGTRNQPCKSKSVDINIAPTPAISSSQPPSSTKTFTHGGVLPSTSNLQTRKLRSILPFPSLPTATRPIRRAKSISIDENALPSRRPVASSSSCGLTIPVKGPAMAAMQTRKTHTRSAYSTSTIVASPVFTVGRATAAVPPGALGTISISPIKTLAARDAFGRSLPVVVTPLITVFTSAAPSRTPSKARPSERAVKTNSITSSTTSPMSIPRKKHGSISVRTSLGARQAPALALPERQPLGNTFDLNIQHLHRSLPSKTAMKKPCSVPLTATQTSASHAEVS
ncbi:hypothetical protein HWV62_45126 [Athelia sp. TMB]|nr:hypothetical protein HWV62_45126 [Athelia sp. TMB]